MSLHFDEATHTYTVDGKRLPSVTEVARFCAYDYKSAQPWLAEAAARRGTAVHEACALIDYGEEPEETPEISGYLTAYRRFLKDYRPDWKLIEYPMGDLTIGYAGTLDRFGILSNGLLVLLDIKTGQLHDAALRAQLTGYLNLLKSLPGHRTAWPKLYALKLSRDGTYDLRQIVPDADNIAKAVLDALNGLAYPDDSAVQIDGCHKIYTTAAPRVEVTIEEVIL